MRALLILLACCALAAASQAADAVTGHIVKVLPFLMDEGGRIATSPSLFDRDAYQAFLRTTNKLSGVRFDVLWNAQRSPDEKIRITMELRGVATNSVPRVQSLETNGTPRYFRQWTSLQLAGADYQNFGSVVAWRARLWNGTNLLAEKQSFLW